MAEYQNIPPCWITLFEKTVKTDGVLNMIADPGAGFLLKGGLFTRLCFESGTDVTNFQSACSRDVKNKHGFKSIFESYLLIKKCVIMMIYSFICPAPCNNKVVVHADDYDDAANKLTDAGALRCRNDRYGCYCEKSWHEMTSIPEDQLKNIIKMCMQEESEKSNDLKHISSSLYP